MKRMLSALYIQDIVTIDRLNLPVGRGLTALTGETGAGKSILLDALGLAVGGRAERALVRPGAAQGVAAASFEPPEGHSVWALLERNGVAAEEAAVILKRVQGADGRARAFINDQPVSVGLLREIGEALIEVHGQNDGYGFLRAEAHRDLLDAYGGLGEAARETRKAWADWRTALSALEEQREAREKAANEADYLRSVVEELDALDPRAGEEDDLAARRAALQGAEQATEDLAEAAEALAGEGFESRLAAALRRLERAAERFETAAPEAAAPIADAARRVEAALTEIDEARRAVSAAAAGFDADPDALERIETRLFTLRGAARKFGATVEGLADVRDRAHAALDSVEAGEAALERLETAARRGEAAYRAAAEALSGARKTSAKALEAAVAGELEPLKLSKAQFAVGVTRTDRPGPDGLDRIEFLISTNPGAPLGPLRQIASGGELSRFVLAMKAALAAKEDKTVIIFDEVDAGVGGAVADAVGERLARLAAGAQVLVVTHSPQVAARADAHWRVEKDVGERASTSVAALPAQERVEEIARMLSGAKVTAQARAAAKTLLDGATRARKTRRKAAAE